MVPALKVFLSTIHIHLSVPLFFAPHGKGVLHPEAFIRSDPYTHTSIYFGFISLRTERSYLEHFQGYERQQWAAAWHRRGLFVLLDTFAVADIALMTRDLDSAEAGFRKSQTFPGTDNGSRAQRGLDAVSKARTKAQQQLTFAKDLAAKKQYASAIDNFRSAGYLNPRLADAHLGLDRFHPALTSGTHNDRNPNTRSAHGNYHRRLRIPRSIWNY